MQDLPGFFLRQGMVKQTNKKDLYQKCGILEARVGIYQLQLKINF